MTPSLRRLGSRALVAAATLLALPAGAGAQACVFRFERVPPPCGYRAETHAEFNPAGGRVEFGSGSHSGFSGINATNVGPNQRETFTSRIDVLVSLFGGPFTPMTFQNVPVETEVRERALRTTGFFIAEMRRLDIVGPGFIVREDPDKESLGELTVTPLPGGLFEFTSFFDIWFELSLDGGVTFTDAEAASRVVLVGPAVIPEPSTVALLATGLAVLAGGVARRGRRATA